MNSIARRIRRLENLALRYRAESGPNPVDVLMERRRKCAIAEGRKPEPDRPPTRWIDSNGRCLSLAEILLENRRIRV